MFGLQKFLLLLVLTCFGQLVHGIIHGGKAPESSMRYMVSVQNNGGHVCGGFLITNNFVVTAAHCYHYHPTHVVLGNHNLKNGQMVAIKKKFVHNSYESPETGDDIMLLQLATTNGLRDVIQLPHAEIDLTANEVCQVAGWGKTMSGGKYVGELRVVDVSVINPQVCKNQWSQLPANVICAGGYGTSKGFCQGDSGGPLVCKGFAVGIVSFNHNRNCNYPELPNVYTDISKYLQWIDMILHNHQGLTVKPHMFCCLHY
ncbi:trypsin-like [Oreochromis aureus]|uniref:Peptidase S1 domain-containing protein n=1 Tax=Oreochromis aureus TaxID=47969 RepID=A0A668SPR5_OREAU|nr:trypsin-like [Oreochromis aureus]